MSLIFMHAVQLSALRPCALLEDAAAFTHMCSSVVFFHRRVSEALAQVAQRGGGVSSLETSNFRLEGL